MTNLQSLLLGSKLLAADVATIACAPFIPQLTKLRIAMDVSDLPNEGVYVSETHEKEANAQLATLSLLFKRATNLVELYLWDVPNENFLQEAPLENLQKLVIHHCEHLGIIRHLVAHVRPKLKLLLLEFGTYFPAHEMGLLFSAGPEIFPELTRLEISYDECTDWTVIKEINLPSLRTLRLEANNLPPGEDTIRYLMEPAMNGRLANLKVLELNSRYYGAIDPKGILDVVAKQRVTIF